MVMRLICNMASPTNKELGVPLGHAKTCKEQAEIRRDMRRLCCDCNKFYRHERWCNYVTIMKHLGIFIPTQVSSIQERISLPIED